MKGEKLPVVFKSKICLSGRSPCDPRCVRRRVVGLGACRRRPRSARASGAGERSLARARPASDEVAQSASKVDFHQLGALSAQIVGVGRKRASARAQASGASCSSQASIRRGPCTSAEAVRMGPFGRLRRRPIGRGPLAELARQAPLACAGADARPRDKGLFARMGPGSAPDAHKWAETAPSSKKPIARRPRPPVPSPRARRRQAEGDGERPLGRTRHHGDRPTRRAAHADALLVGTVGATSVARLSATVSVRPTAVGSGQGVKGLGDGVPVRVYASRGFESQAPQCTTSPAEPALSFTRRPRTMALKREGSPLVWLRSAINQVPRDLANASPGISSSSWRRADRSGEGSLWPFFALNPANHPSARWLGGEACDGCVRRVRVLASVEGTLAQNANRARLTVGNVGWQRCSPLLDDNDPAFLELGSAGLHLARVPACSCQRAVGGAGGGGFCVWRVLGLQAWPLDQVDMIWSRLFCSCSSRASQMARDARLILARGCRARSPHGPVKLR
ncbi:hypothetical protein T492DRAFT_846462 [Pavlovales sp. CCMP2436]|nr:hypothetical protein T492DRAFT_846462 [Pavlovales sp. CCMP2436]